MLKSKTEMAHNKKGQEGNVLFLILIAVALFAALSYTVTQSSRSGGGNVQKDKDTLNSGQIVQYPVAMRSVVLRMIMNGLAIERIAFNSPGNFGSISTERLVYQYEGGGAIFQEAPAEVMAGSSVGQWNTNAEFQIPGIGIDGDGGNELIMFLPGISQGACQQINGKLSIDTSSCTGAELASGIPLSTVDLTVAARNMDDAYTFPTGSTPVLEGTCPVFARHASGCFASASTNPPTYVFFSVLIER